MDLRNTPEQARFRERFRVWLDAHAHDDAPRRRVLAPPDPDEVRRWRAWQSRLADGGYAAVTWPKEYGGAGLGPTEAVIVDQELEGRGLAGVFDYIGIDMVGPTLMARASPEQCARHLAPLMRGDEVWCQLFSEPGAGSDLAAVSTRAVRQGDGTWLVNGQKVWTTHAQHASFGIMLARTAFDGPKHRGLTMFIVSMDAPGLTIRPLRQITGDAEFNEVFLDDVRLSAEAVIDEPGAGWSVAMTMLGFERMSVGSGTHSAPLDQLVRDVAGAVQAESVAERLGAVAARLLALKFQNYRLLTDLEQGRMPGPEVGLVKISAVHASLDACRLVADVLGHEALVTTDWGHQISALPALRSAGGTEEILRNVIGERVLQLPPEPKVSE